MGLNPAPYTFRLTHNSAATAGPGGGIDMVETLEKGDLRALTPAPTSPLPYRRQPKAAWSFHTWLGDFWPQCVSPASRTAVRQVEDSWT